MKEAGRAAMTLHSLRCRIVVSTSVDSMTDIWPVIPAAAAFIGALAACSAVVVAYRQFKASPKQEIQGRKTQLSAMYLQRYWEIDVGLLITSKGKKRTSGRPNATHEQAVGPVLSHPSETAR